MTHGNHHHDKTDRKHHDDATKTAASKRDGRPPPMGRMDATKVSPDPTSNVFNGLDHVHLESGTDWTIATTDQGQDGDGTTYALAGALLKVNNLPPIARTNAQPLALVAYIYDGDLLEGAAPFVAAIASLPANATACTLQTTVSTPLDGLRIIGIPTIDDWRAFLSGLPQPRPQWNARIIFGGGDHPGDGNGI